MKTQEPTKEKMILSAAMDVFIEQGWSGARMQEIADRAGINKTLLHYYFRSKEKIYARILEEVFFSFFAQIESALTDSGSFADILRRFIDTVIDTLAANPRVPLFIMEELSRGGNTATGILAATVARKKMTLPKRMIELITKEQEAGRIGPVVPTQFVITLLGACFYFFIAEPVIRAVYSTIRRKLIFDRARFIAERKEEIFNVLYNGLRKREGGDER